MDRSSIVYVAFVAVAALIALAERVYARRNERRLMREGAVEVAPWVFRWMAPVYTLIFPAAIAEHVALARRPPLLLAGALFVLFAGAKTLKLWAVLHLGDLWTMRVILPRELRVVTGGPYRYVRHPNYVAVVGEILALPLAGGAWITTLAGGALFGLLLRARVRSEETALLARPEYSSLMAGKPRFLPGAGR